MCSSKSFETAYAQRRVVDGPITSWSSSVNGGVALPYTSEVEAMTMSASSASATLAGRVDALDVRLERLERPAVARDLLRREVDDRVAALRTPSAARAGSCSRRPRDRTAGSCSDAPRDCSRVAAREVVDADDLDPFRQQRSHRCDPMKPAAPVPRLHDPPQPVLLGWTCRLHAAALNPRQPSEQPTSRPATPMTAWPFTISG